MKYYLRILISFLLLFTGFPVNSQTFPSNTLKFGDGTNTDKKITANKGGSNPQLKYSATAGSWQFSNDGTNFSDFGSGSGGGGAGLNLISKNPDFEQGSANGWSNTGGTYAAVSSGSNLLFGKGSVTFTAGGSGQFVQSDLYTIPEGLGGKNCLAKIYYKGGATSYLLKVLDGSSNLIASQSFPVVATKTEVNPLNFICPASGQQIRLRVESTAAASLIALDRSHLGEADNLFQLSQATFVGSVKFTGTVGCFWDVNSTTYIDFPAEPACPFPVVSGDALSANTVKTPSFKLKAKPGTYRIVASGGFLEGTGGSTGSAFYRFTDGTQFSRSTVMYMSSTGFTYGGQTVDGELSYNSAQEVTIGFQAASELSGVNVSILSEQLATRELNIAVYYFPSEAQTVLKPETIGWDVDTAWTGGNYSLALGTNPSSAIPAANVTFTNKGSLTARVPCGSSASTGVTCAGSDEEFGVDVNIPASGKVEVCAEFSTAQQPGSGAGSIYNSFKLVRVTPITNAVLETGASAQSVGMAGTTSASLQEQPVHICGVFNAVAGINQFKVFNETVQSGTVFTKNNINFATSTGGTQNSGRIKIRPLNQNIPTPVLVNSVISSSASPERTERALVGGSSSGGYSNCTTSPCTVVTQSGSWISSVTRTSQGAYSVNLSSQFGSTPFCAANALLYGGGSTITCLQDVQGSSPSSLSILCLAAGGGGTDVGFSVLCQGPK